MNLSDHFDPMPPPQDGLRSVHRRARRRAVINHATKAGGLLTALMLVTLLPTLAIDYFYNTSSQVLSGGQASTDSEPSLGVAPGPSSNPLPGSEISKSFSDTNAALVVALVGILLIVLTAVKTMRREPPSLRTSTGGRIAYLVGSVLVVATALWTLLVT